MCTFNFIDPCHRNARIFLINISCANKAASGGSFGKWFEGDIGGWGERGRNRVGKAGVLG